jgi:hypothetical protein
VRVLRVAVLACVLAVLAGVLADRATTLPCRTDGGPCARPGLPQCDRTLGPWHVTRSDSSGLPAARSHSACVLAASRPVVAIVPQARGVSGDTLLSRRAASHAHRQRARVTLATRGALPDHWAFAVAGGFLDVDTRVGCGNLAVRPPVNAGYALIGGNWQARPHGFYFERLADAFVYDDTASGSGEAAWLPHEFVPGETFALDLAMTCAGEACWLAATVALLEGEHGAEPRSLGRMRRAVAAPCWLAPDDPGRALVLVIPEHDGAAGAPDTRVEVSDFAWLE